MGPDYTSTTRHENDKTHGTKVSQSVPKVELNTGGCNDALSIDYSQRAIRRRIMKEVERCGGAHLLFIFIKVKRSSWGDTV